MPRLRVKSKIFLVAFVGALLSLALPAVIPLCYGAKGAAMRRHPCCAGKMDCGAQFQKVPCCEYQTGTKATQPYRESLSGSDFLAAPVLSSFVALPPSILPKNFWRVRIDERHAQAPPLYLSKQSFLC